MLQGSGSWPRSATASEPICAFLAPGHEQHPPLPSPWQSTQGTCIRSCLQSTVGCEGAPSPSPSAPRQSQAKVWPEPRPPAKPREMSERGVGTELVRDDRVTFWDPGTQPSPLRFLAGSRAGKPTPFSSEGPLNLFLFQSYSKSHLIHCSADGQPCRKPGNGTPQKPRALRPVQLSPHGVTSGPRTFLSAGRLSVPPEQNPVSGHWKFPISCFDPGPRAPHADPLRETRKPGGLPPDLRSRRVRPSLPLAPPPSSSPRASRASRASRAQRFSSPRAANYFLG